MAGRTVLFDRGPLGQGTQFSDPFDIIEAWTPEDVPAAFEKMQAAQRSGRWVVGSATYELGYVFSSKLRGLMPDGRKEPLLRFGVFAGPHEPVAHSRQIPAHLGPLTPKWDFDAYAQAFEIVKDNIRNGEFYQTNLTFPLTATLHGSARSLYDALVERQTVPFGAFVDLGDVKLLSRSPELFFSLSSDGVLKSRPMKGTARRGTTDAEDTALKAELAASEKNRAENLMITDLIRNDLGRIAKIGSVKVPDLFRIESYTTVHQMTSEVVADILPDQSLHDIFEAVFPCGSITGAPKIRAMEVLSELEPWPRGGYCGAIGWIAPDGSMEFNVAIRTLICESNNTVTLNVGGGVVYDSTARGEYEEAILKSGFARGLK